MLESMYIYIYMYPHIIIYTHRNQYIYIYSFIYSIFSLSIYRASKLYTNLKDRRTQQNLKILTAIVLLRSHPTFNVKPQKDQCGWKPPGFTS